MGVDRLQQEHRVRARWRAFPLRPHIPPGGLSLEEALGTDPDEAWAVARSLRDTATELGLHFGELKRVYNSRLAQELAAWAATRGRGRTVHDALFRTFFVEAKDIGDVETLTDMAEAAGLDRQEARRVLEERFFQEAVDEDWARARELGIRVAPTFLTEGRRLEGMKAYDVLEAWLRGDTLLNSF